ncbi:MAG: enediyne biosynthesis protein UnbU [Methylococcales bacterium]
MEQQDLRLPALRRFAAAITVLTLLGHSFLGFEPSYASVFVSLGVSYTVELVLETVSAWSTQRVPRYQGGLLPMVNFLLSPHITGLAIAMLLYSNENLLPIAFAASVANGSKYIFNVTTERGARHFFNPSNTGISITLLAFPWVGIAPPYQFSENITGYGDWGFVVFICILGTFLNARFTKRMPLITAWLVGFFLQAWLRNGYFDTSIVAALNPMTGLAFLLFTFYMVSDPGTTPFKMRDQIIFGAAVALVYALLVMLHVVFGLFFSLFIVCSLRGAFLYYQAWANTAPTTINEAIN